MHAHTPTLYLLYYSSATAATQERTRRDSHDTFFSSDEESPLKSPVAQASRTKKREKERDSQSDSDSSSEDDEEQEKREVVERNPVIKERREGANKRGASQKSESESESDLSSSSEDEEEGKRGLNGGGVGSTVGGVTETKQAITLRNSVKEKV